MGVYDSDRDSIALPITALTLTLLALSTIHLIQLFLHSKKLKSKIGKFILIGSLGLLATISLIILASSAVYWWLPNHTIISLFYCMTASAFIYNQINFFRKN